MNKYSGLSLYLRNQVLILTFGSSAFSPNVNFVHLFKIQQMALELKLNSNSLSRTASSYMIWLGSSLLFHACSISHSPSLLFSIHTCFFLSVPLMMRFLPLGVFALCFPYLLIFFKSQVRYHLPSPLPLPFALITLTCFISFIAFTSMWIHLFSFLKYAYCLVWTKL